MKTMTRAEALQRYRREHSIGYYVTDEDIVEMLGFHWWFIGQRVRELGQAFAELKDGWNRGRRR